MRMVIKDAQSHLSEGTDTSSQALINITKCQGFMETTVFQIQHEFVNQL